MTGGFTLKNACLFLFQCFYFHSALVALQTSPEGLDCCQNAECYFHISIPHRKGSWEIPLSPVCQLMWPGSQTSHSTLYSFSCYLRRVYLFNINHTHIRGKWSANFIQIAVFFNENKYGMHYDFNQSYVFKCNPQHSCI